LSQEELMQRQLNTNFPDHGTNPCARGCNRQGSEDVAALKPYYAYGCKRPTFHDEYLPTFNLPQ